MLDKRFIFTVTTGRTGTGYLANLLGIFQDTITYHEPSPSYAICLRQAQEDSEIAKSFLLNQKIPSICRLSIRPIYIETTHLFCKGFLEPWLEISELPAPDLILLERDLREVAVSYLRLQTIPGKATNGLKFLLAPWDKTCLTSVKDWESLNDYQLCYWYCLEMEERKKLYREMILKRGKKCYSTSIEKLQTVGGILDARKSLDLPALTIRGWLAYFKRRGNKINSKDSSKTDIVLDDRDIDHWEGEVKDRLMRVNHPG
jgi:hypothetical protein